MRILTLFLLTCLAVGAQYLPHRRLAFQPAIASDCTVNSGNITNESWEGADLLTWTDTGTVDRNAALSGTSPCSGLGSESAEVNWDGTGSAPRTSWDRGSNLTTSTLYYRIYFYITSHSTAHTDNTSIFTAGESATPITGHQFRLQVVNSSGQLKLFAITGVSQTASLDISTGTWYRAEVKYVNNSVGQSEFKLYDSGGSQIGSTGTWNTGNNYVRYIHVGTAYVDHAKAFRVQLDGLGVSDAGYLGQ